MCFNNTLNLSSQVSWCHDPSLPVVYKAPLKHLKIRIPRRPSSPPSDLTMLLIRITSEVIPAIHSLDTRVHGVFFPCCCPSILIYGPVVLRGSSICTRRGEIFDVLIISCMFVLVIKLEWGTFILNSPLKIYRQHVSTMELRKHPVDPAIASQQDQPNS